MKSKVYLDRQEIWFIIGYLAEQVRRNTRFPDAETTFEDLIFETQEIIDEKSEDDLLWEIEESNFYFQYNGEDVPNMNEMLTRYIRFKNENSGGTDVADILNKAERIRELVKGYLFEILVFFANEYGIPKNEEMTQRQSFATSYLLRQLLFFCTQGLQPKSLFSSSSEKTAKLTCDVLDLTFPLCPSLAVHKCSLRVPRRLCNHSLSCDNFSSERSPYRFRLHLLASEVGRLCMTT